jgi:hypothetical protein
MTPSKPSQPSTPDPPKPADTPFKRPPMVPEQKGLDSPKTEERS